MFKEDQNTQLYYDATLTHRRNLTKLDTLQSNSNVHSFLSLQSPIHRKLSESNGLEKKILSSRSSMHRMIEHYSKNYDLIQNSDHFEMITEIQPQISPSTSIQKIKEIDIKHDGSLFLQELKPSATSTIQIARFRFNYFYVRIFEKEAPVQVYIKSEQSKLQTFKMYVSTTAQFPTSFNCELAVQSKYFKFQDPQQRDLFHVKNLYISMYSEEDCLLQIAFVFGHYLKKRIKLIKEEPNLEKYKSQLNALSSSKLELLRTDKITYNLNTKQYSKDKLEQKLKLNQRILDNRIMQAMEKKRLIYEDKKMDIICKLQANDSLKEIRNAQKQLELRQRLLMRNQVVWIEIISIAVYAQRLKEMLNQTKLHNKYLAKGRLMVWQYKTIAMIKIKGSGTTVEERSRFKLCLSICLFSYQFKHVAKQRAVKTIMSFMHATHLYIQCLIKHRYFVDKGSQFADGSQLRQESFQKYEIKEQGLQRSFVEIAFKKWIIDHVRTGLQIQFNQKEIVSYRQVQSSFDIQYCLILNDGSIYQSKEIKMVIVYIKLHQREKQKKESARFNFKHDVTRNVHYSNL